MKFAAKMTLSTIALLCVTLGVGGAVNLGQNFAQAKETALTAYAAEHERSCFSLETKLARTGSEDLPVSQILAESASWVQGEVGVSAQIAVLSQSGSVLYSNLLAEIPYADLLAAIDTGAEGALFLRAKEKVWVVMATPLQGLSRPLWLAQAWNAAALFADRDRQLYQYFALSIAVVLTAGAVAAAGSLWLTRPLRQLERASRALASGQLDARVALNSKDEIQQIGGEFNRMADAIAGQMQALREESAREKRFVAAFSHELKTPMTAMLGYAALLEKGQLPPEQQSKAAGYLFRESSRLEILSRQLLQLMQLQGGGVELAPARIAPVLTEATADLPELSVRIEIRCPPEAMGRINIPLLADLLRNLVRNAAAAQPKDGMVRVGCERGEKGWILWVADRGRGIPPEMLDRVMEPFFRVDKGRSRSEGGNGLGLALCRMIAKAHGSALQIESCQNEGTRVWLELPPCEEEKGGDGEE